MKQELISLVVCLCLARAMEYTFNFRQAATGSIISYRESETLYNDSLPEYIALDCGNDLIDKVRAYYKQGFKEEIPRSHLFAINC